MTDARCPDRWLTDRRIQRLTPAGFRLFFNALMWSVSNKTDGILEPDDLPMIPGYSPGLEDELATATPALWTWRNEAWFIAEFIDTQTTRAEHEALASARKSKRESQARWRAKQAVDATETSCVEATETVTTQDRTGQDVVTANAVTTSPEGEVINFPSSKASVVTDGGTSPARARNRGTRLPEGWEPAEEVIRAMHAECPGVDLRGEHRAFTDYWRDQTGARATRIDWVGTWRNWMRKAAKEIPRRNGRSIDTAANTRAWLAGGSEP